MDLELAQSQLRERLTELHNLSGSTFNVDFQEWQPKTRRTLERALGEDHVLSHQFVQIRYTPHEAWGAGLNAAVGILKTALFELEVLTEESNVAEPESVDPELFDHVRHLIEQEQWGQVASQA
jgi:hypothetical protein